MEKITYVAETRRGCPRAECARRTEPITEDRRAKLTTELGTRERSCTLPTHRRVRRADHGSRYAGMIFHATDMQRVS